jgi:predicted metal-dependent peptidase
MGNDARARIDAVTADWFFSEPLLFVTYCSHTITENRLQHVMLRTGQMHIEYNPDLIARVNDICLAEQLKTEVIRILLRHPYQRQPQPFIARAAYTASNITITQKGLFEWNLPPAKCFEEYYKLLLGKMIQLKKKNAVPQDTQNKIKSSGSTGQESGTVQSTDSRQSSNGQNDNQKNLSGQNDQNQTVARADGGGENKDAYGQESGTVQSTDFRQNNRRQNDNQKDSPEQNDPQKATEQQASDGTALWEEDVFVCERIVTLIKGCRSWGSVPAHIQEQITADLTVAFDYHSVLRGFRASVISSKRCLTRMKPNRRTGFIYMGSKYDFTTKLLVAVDDSGSIAEEDLARFYSIINHFFKYGIAEIDVIQFDAQIQGKPLTLQKARKGYTVTGRGGTNFQCVFDFVSVHPEYDGLIIFTDGFAPVPFVEKSFRTKLVWVCCSKESWVVNHKWMETTGKTCWLESLPLLSTQGTFSYCQLG